MNDLDTEYNQRLSDWLMSNVSIERSNAIRFDADCKRDDAKLCNVCAYPIDADNFRLVQHGDVCRVCYDLWHAVSERQWFVSVQREFNEGRNVRGNWQ